MNQFRSLQKAIDYLGLVIQWRLEDVFKLSASADITTTQQRLSLKDAPHLDVPHAEWLVEGSAIANFFTTHNLTREEQLTVLIALVPHLQPHFFDQAITAQLPEAGDYPQLGGWRGTHHRGFLPTGDTVLFILGGTELSDRLRIQTFFSPQHVFAQRQILSVHPPEPGEPLMSGRLVLAPDTINLLLYGTIAAPHFSIQFPANLIKTEMTWDDLVLNSATREQIKELETWITHSATLLHDWGMKRTLKLGYRALFYGPSGTGKTLTASLLGKYTNRAVYKIDISMVVSKFIGETEKNLASLFEKAESKGWILFFDEADAMFGKRTSVRDAHDKYANQEVSYLLQRIENYDGLVILASNLKNNIDEAFARRLQSIIHFPLPGVKERSRLWQAAFPPQVTLDKAINISDLATQYELSGADIMNVVQYCCLQALDRGDLIVNEKDLRRALQREFAKVGKILS
ncbi:MAG: ATP-binding protein [Phormidesmis sp.]